MTSHSDRPRRANHDLVDIEGRVLIRREKAIYFDAGDAKPIWLPLSQIEINDDGSVTMPEWLALEKGLI
jgi:hypothetical protein